MPKEFEKPAVASWPIWKTVLTGLAMGVIFTSLSWGTQFLLHRYIGLHNYSLTIGPILLGSFWLLFVLWMRWAWQPGRKHGRWYRWLGNLVSGVYVFGLILSGAIVSWNTLLNKPWSWMVNSVLIVLFVVAWLLPALSYRWAKKIAGAQDDLGLKMLAYGGPAGLMVLAGILGANFGMDASRNGELGSEIFIMAILFSLLAIFWTQYAAEQLWGYRPWAKEEDEE